MQLIFGNTAIRPAARARPHPRRGTFALEPVDALSRLAEAVERLAERALEPNPFLLPAFLEPALRALGTRGVRLATFSDRDELRFFAPVLLSGGVIARPKLSIWTHAYAPLGSPLVDAAFGEEAAEGVLRHIRVSGRSILTLPELPLAGPVAALLKAAAARRGFSIEAARQMRPVLDADDPEGAAAFDRMLTQKRRRELDRQLRRLCETGSVSFMSARSPSDITLAFDTFIALEAGGWKGRRGTALRRRGKILDFARSAVIGMAQQGYAAIDIMRVGDRPLGALIRLDFGGLSIPWKIAYDESFGAYSPGKQLMCDETRRWLLDPRTHRVDPVCEEDNPLMAGLWAEREPYGSLIISSRRWGLGARLRAGLLDARQAGRKRAKMLIRPKAPAKARPAKAKPAP
jgi:hypothetical protein